MVLTRGSAGISGPLSHPSVPEPEIVRRISLEGLLEFRDRHLRGGSVVVGGVGVEPSHLLQVSKGLFGSLRSGAHSHSFLMRYHGGDCTIVEGEERTRVHALANSHL